MQTFQDANIVVTGATGWLGKATLAQLETHFGDTLEKRVFAFASCASEVELCSGRHIRCAPLADLRGLQPGRYFFMHYAFLTKDRVAGLSLADYLRLNEQISDHVVNAARRVETAGIFVPSSGAVYRSDRSLEDDIERNPYGATKLRDEERFTRLAEKLHCPLTITRVFNMAGPYINKLGAYALASILDDILNRRSVTLRAAHRVVRSYMHVEDLVALALVSLASAGSQPLLFDTVGDVEIEIGDLALLALAVMGNPEGEVRRPPMSGTVEDRYVGDGAAMLALAKAQHITLRPLRQQIRDTANYLAMA